MPNTELTLADAQKEVTTELGCSHVHIELDPADIQKCLKDAIRVYNRNFPQRSRAAITVTSGQVKYGPLNTGFPSLQGIVQVEFTDPLREISDHVDPFDPLSVLNRWEFTFMGDTIGQFSNRLMYLEELRRVVSSEPEWFAQWEDKDYYLYVSIPRTYRCSVTYTWHVTADDDPVTGMCHVNDGDVQWVIDFTTARSKQILSRIRGKYQGITGPDGGDQQIDWDSLASEGREDEERLTEDMKKRRRPLAPLLE